MAGMEAAMPTAPLLDRAALDRFARDGFLLGPKVVDDAALEELRSELDRVIAENGKAGVPQPTRIANLSGNEATPVWQIVNIWEGSDAFRRLMNIPGLPGAIQAMIGGREIRLWHDQIQYKPKGIGGVNSWHQDWPYWPTMSVANAVTGWIAIDDAGQDNGCMSMVPGSHRWGNAIEHLHTIKDFSKMPAEYQGSHTVAQLCPVPAGHVHFHHSLTWHGSHANTSDRPRRAIALHFMNETVTRTGKGHLCEHYCESQVGEPIRGEHFPLVWRDGSQVEVPVPSWMKVPAAV
jgi:ectoine hydroxylase-related dioxygenase (phytanoyl-CoA dioxygenase family)